MHMYGIFSLHSSICKRGLFRSANIQKLGIYKINTLVTGASSSYNAYGANLAPRARQPVARRNGVDIRFLDHTVRGGDVRCTCGVLFFGDCSPKCQSSRSFDLGPG